MRLQPAKPDPEGLIEEAGRKDTIGRPILYRTTDQFLSHFGIQSLDELPPMPENETEINDMQDHEEILTT